MNTYTRSLFIVVVLAITLFGVSFLLGNKSMSVAEEEVYCTDDAFRCSDGRYVGRVPPRCEFASCDQRQENQKYFISVDAPRASARVTQPFQVRGTARLPDNIVQYELRDERGGLISSGYVYTGAEEEGASGPFVIHVESSLPSGSLAILSLFGRDALHEKTTPLQMALTLK